MTRPRKPMSAINIIMYGITGYACGNNTYPYVIETTKTLAIFEFFRQRGIKFTANTFENKWKKIAKKEGLNLITLLIKEINKE